MFFCFFNRNTAANWDDLNAGPWFITLKKTVFSRYLEYCPSEEARKHMFISYNQLCSRFGDSRLKVTHEFESIRKYRLLYAKTLGFPSYAHLSMKNKMAENVENVQGVLTVLLENSKNAHERELYELEKFAFDNDFKKPIESWDFPYWSRMYLKKELNIDEMTLVNYFPFSQVLLGVIALCEQLFGIVIEEQLSVEGWHRDVRFFRISDSKTKNVLGGFYLDPYASKNKKIKDQETSHFVPIKSKSKICNSIALSALIFNFSPPELDKPSLLYLKEVSDFFEKVS